MEWDPWEAIFSFSLGFWFMHCHTEFHNLEGMALVIKVGNESQMNRTPKNMRPCGNADPGLHFLGATVDNSTDGEHTLPSAIASLYGTIMAYIFTFLQMLTLLLYAHQSMFCGSVLQLLQPLWQLSLSSLMSSCSAIYSPKLVTPESQTKLNKWASSYTPNYHPSFSDGVISYFWALVHFSPLCAPFHVYCIYLTSFLTDCWLPCPIMYPHTSWIVQVECYEIASNGRIYWNEFLHSVTLRTKNISSWQGSKRNQ